MENRAIVHMDLDAFFVEVERLKSPGLRGVPLAVGGSVERGVVCSASYEARAFGVRSGMNGKQAKALCPDIYFVRGDFASYSYYSDMVTDILAESAPVLEKASIDEFYMDLTGMDRFIGTYHWVSELRARIRHETGLNISFGLSKNKTVSKMATREVKPNGQVQVPYGTEKAFIAPLDISRIPMLGKKTAPQLYERGIRTVGELADTPIHHLENLLGVHGRVLWLKANAVYESAVEPWSIRKSYSKENTYGENTTDLGFLFGELDRLVTELVFDLRQAGKMAGCLTLKIRYGNFETHTLQEHMPYTCADHDLLPRVQALFRRLHQPGRPIRLMGVKFSKLLQGNYQLRLFDESMRMAGLYTAMDAIRHRYGIRAVQRASYKTMVEYNINPFGRSRPEPPANW